MFKLPSGGRILRSSGSVRFVQGGVVKTFRYVPPIMPDADPFPKVKRAVIRRLLDGVGPHGFTQLRTTTYFVRDREAIRDVFFFQKMRSNTITICYGVMAVPDDDWTPCVPNARWLRDQESYRCKYVDHVDGSIGRAIADLESEALPWWDGFVTADDLPPARGGT
ncbi:hypothetical protein CEE69_16970 [Rhodopirellula bahusiensis]|uniref:Uncharacterized protein n=2 Tax=Rhodopirellula bahusiensis TaxID=2014065 RepID=A0A2G1W4M6_9BACT|nr:hypothetical protein CEE69_16970 [Rhodopirellula bahusiensis]